MRPIGFSTGALALGDFRTGLKWQRRPGFTAVELSALREDELGPLLAAIDTLDLDQFEFRSLHAPSRLQTLSNADLVTRLRPAADRGFPIVVHPDVIDDPAPWQVLGDRLLLENMDQRKSTCRTAAELAPFFQALPEARFCFDVGHARQVDPTMSVAVDFLLQFRDRLAEIHISEVNWRCQHVAIGAAAALAFRRVTPLIPDDTPTIIESMVGEAGIDEELQIASACLDVRQRLFLSQPSPECV